MLKIYLVVLEIIGELRPVLAQIERRDSDLCRQLRRAASSVALNWAEGMYSLGKNRTVRYHTALGSMRETRACLEVPSLSATSVHSMSNSDVAWSSRSAISPGTIQSKPT